MPRWFLELSWHLFFKNPYNILIMKHLYLSFLFIVCFIVPDSFILAQEISFEKGSFEKVFFEKLKSIHEDSTKSTTEKDNNYLEILDKAHKFVQVEKDTTLYYNFLTRGGEFMFRHNPTLLTQLHQNWEKHFEENNLLINENIAYYYRYISLTYYVLQQDSMSLVYINKTIDMKHKLQLYDNNLAKDYTHLSNCNIVLKDFSGAINALEKALTLATSDTLLINIHQNFAQCYQQINELELALKHIDLSYALNQKVFGKNNGKSDIINRLIKAQILSNLHQFYLSLENLENLEKRVLEETKLTSQSQNTLISIYYYTSWAYINLYTHNYMDKEALQQALLSINKGIKMLEDNNIPNPTLVSNYITLTYIHYLKRDLNAYTQSQKITEAYIKKHFPNEKKYLGDIHLMNGQFYTLEIQHEKSALSFQQYLELIVEGYKANHAFDFPSLNLFEKSPNSVNAILQNFNPFIENLYEAYKYTQEEKYLHEILKHIKNCEALIHYQEQHIFKSSTYANLNNNNAYIMQGIYANGIYALYTLYQKNKNPEYLDLAFIYMERCRGINLLKKINTTQAAFIQGISKKDIQKDSTLRASISQINQALFLLNNQANKSENLGKLLALQDQLTQAKKAYDEHTYYLESTYPAYKKLKYNLHIVTLQEAQKLLQPEQALVSYFIASKGIFVFDIRKENATLHLIDKESKNFNKLLEKFHKQVAQSFNNTTEAINSKFTQNAHDLYNILLGQLDSLPARLIIIPDKLLNIIPFEVLLTAPVQDPTLSFKDYPFLLHKSAISYNYSASLLQTMQSPSMQPYKKQYLGFAPSFSEALPVNSLADRYGLTKLSANEKEIQAIQSLLNTGKVYLNDKATKENFLSDASYYRILHLATHGLANHQDPNYSFLAFTNHDEREQNSLLYVNELYNMYLSAELVVLSACETGVGNLSQGEGILSLARAFAAAGAKSLFTTLWKVNDQSTANIVMLFFKHLKEGKPKDIALQAAKLEYLQLMHENSLSPAFWAAYNIIGNDAPLENMEENNTIYFVTGSMVLIILIGGFAYTRKRKKDKSYA